MQETTKENTTRSGCETVYDKESIENGNGELVDDGDEEQSDGNDGKHWDDDNKNDVNSAENLLFFTEVDSSINLLHKQFKNHPLNTDVQIS